MAITTTAKTTGASDDKLAPRISGRACLVSKERPFPSARAPALGKPADPAALHRIALAIRAGLNELGHPEANVRISREEASNATAVRFEINDGPLLRVRRV